MTAAGDFARFIGDRKFGAILADPPWQFVNRTGKVAPEHRRLCRYPTLPLREILDLPVAAAAAEKAHLYLWVPNALLPEGLAVLDAWGFTYKSNIVWQKIRKDGGPDGRGVGFYFRNATELLLFGTRGGLRTLAPARSRVNVISSRKREHSRKPEEQYELIEACSPGPWLELFARGTGGGAVGGVSVGGGIGGATIGDATGSGDDVSSDGATGGGSKGAADGPNDAEPREAQALEARLIEASARGNEPASAQASGARQGWTFWGNQAEDYEITWNTYRNNSGKRQYDPEADD